MWATKAQHKLGSDITRERGDFCVVSARKGSNYIGNWMTGFGLAYIEFPVASTRRLTRNERRYCDDMSIVII
jgi:hypothetical protein